MINPEKPTDITIPADIIDLHLFLTDPMAIVAITGVEICAAEIIITKHILVQIQFEIITERNKNRAVVKTETLKTITLLNIFINFGANKVAGIANIEDTAKINAMVSEVTENISSKYIFVKVLAIITAVILREIIMMIKKKILNGNFKLFLSIIFLSIILCLLLKKNKEIIPIIENKDPVNSDILYISI